MSDRRDELRERAEIFVREYLHCRDASAAADRADIVFERAAPKTGFYVYLLLCPAERRIFYVGKGVRKRMFMHWREQQRGRVTAAKKFKALRKMADRGEEPVPVVYAQNLSDADALRLEQMLIRGIGRSQLANTQPGVSASRAEVALVQAEASLAKGVARLEGLLDRGADQQILRCTWIVANLIKLRNGLRDGTFPSYRAISLTPQSGEPVSVRLKKGEDFSFERDGGVTHVVVVKRGQDRVGQQL